MKKNVALYLLMYIIQCSLDGGAVSLSDYKNTIGIPNTTYHRHVNNLIDMQMIERVKRDHYRLHPEFVTAVCNHSYERKIPTFQWGVSKGE